MYSSSSLTVSWAAVTLNVRSITPMLKTTLSGTPV